MSTRFAPWSPSTQRTHPCGQLDLKPLFPLWHGFRVAVCIGARHPDDPMPDSALIAAQTMLFVASSRVQQYVNLNYPVWGGAGAETGTGALDRPSESISQAAAASDASRRRAPGFLSPIQFNIAESRASRLHQPLRTASRSNLPWARISAASAPRRITVAIPSPAYDTFTPERPQSTAHRPNPGRRADVWGTHSWPAVPATLR